jgi:hypothetical protein
MGAPVVAKSLRCSRSCLLRPFGSILHIASFDWRRPCHPGYVNGSGPILVVSGGTHAALLFANKRERRAVHPDDYLKQPLPRVEKYTELSYYYPAIEIR